MKKIFAALALFASGAAFAAGTSFGIDYDLKDATNNAANFKGSHEVKAFIKQETSVGTFDAGLIALRNRGGVDTDDANGFEVGYSNGFSYGTFGITGRIGYGRFNNIDQAGGGFTDNSEFVSLGVEASTPITGSTNAFVGYRHRNPLGDSMAHENRYSVGVDYAATKNVSMRLGYAHTRQADLKFNGLVAGVSYSF